MKQLILILVIFIVYCLGFFAQIDVYKITPQVFSPEILFGGKIKIVDKNEILISSIGYRNNGVKTGSVFVYSKIDSNWQRSNNIYPFDGDENDKFGLVISFDNPFLGVKSRKNNDVIYIFNRDDNWSLSTRLLPSDSSEYNNFGASFSLNQSFLIAGAPSDDYSGFTSAGSVIIFNRINQDWIEVDRVYNPNPFNYAFFGNYISVDSNFCVVGAPQSNIGGYRSGAVYILKKNNGIWNIYDRLLPKEISDRFAFGSEVLIKNDLVIISAIGTINNPDFQSRVYIFKENFGRWDEKQTVIAESSSVGSIFGSSLVLTGDSLFITAPYDSVDGLKTGSVYLFERINDSWVQTFRYTPFDGSDNQRFGSSIDVKDGMIVIGSPGDNDRGTNSGSVYVYSKDVVGIEDLTSQVPEVFSLSQNYPNPFNPTTTISFNINQSGVVVLKVFDILGREIETLINSFMQVGNHSVEFDASDLPSGNYIIRLSFLDKNLHKIITLIK